ncbi:related to membrane proteins, contain hemolysin III domain [Ramularia collo-cygni]|uniref:Related to membrane proteins, contain hemolysin III domain n=1 Tax=Ramularia collo-cygni TaxID=112498 RepID=A0A2D3UTM1_9PEZI|nr:related to membrane proteins, contain hemolysin III domain [Ramularia collo-cygni]CZT20872.1 related to membrane proteins, contain hemolysin III domain [Ramularia collo-cygni]
MHTSEVRKRQMRDVNPDSAGAPMNSPKDGARTVTYTETLEWQRDNIHIRRGYRPAKADYREVLISLTFLHNETCNVYSHLLGAVLLPLLAAAFLRILSAPRFVGVSRMDYLMFGTFFCCAEVCLIFSTLYHLLGSHSHGVEQFWLRMDLLGIIIAVVGTFVPGIRYAFICDTGVQKLHWAIIISSGFATAVMICVPKFRRWRTARTCAYLALGASSFIPILHGVQLYGVEYMMRYSGLKWYLLEMVPYGLGVTLYAFRVPERFVPGYFDFWGASHQIFHVSILFGMFIHVVGLNEAFTACHTVDLCKIQAAHRAN